MPNYPKPDYGHFFKVIGGMAVCLTLLHWSPEIATWIQARLFGEAMVVDARRFRMVLVIAYVMLGSAALFNLAGLLWAAWHHRRQSR